MPKPPKAPREEGKRGDLQRYYEKRSADATPEPFGGSGADRPRVFVVQKHAARRLHWDLRLEMNGVLESWAVPQGPSFDPAVKRLAVHTEAHPLEYVDFEGIIPAGNYGAGAMIVWDRGLWVPLEDPEAGMESGKLLFELQGYKLRGAFTLVKTKGRGADEWLLIKKPDVWAAPESTQQTSQASILSGLTVEELRESVDRGAAIRSALAARGAPQQEVDAALVRPMLAELAEAPFSRPGWLFELKYDGFRLIASKDEGEVRLYYRSGLDSTAVFPDLAGALRHLPYRRLVLDGEVVVLDPDGRPSFQRLQKRVQLQRPRDLERAAHDHPATYYVFDLLAFEGFDLRPLPLAERKAILTSILPGAGPLRYSDHVEERGAELYGEVEKMGLEGVVGKRADAPYRMFRSPDWRKVRATKTEELVVVGYSKPKKESRTGFSGLLMARFDGGELVFSGAVGSGFSEAELVRLHRLVAPKARKTPPCKGEIPRTRGTVWVEPELVIEVRYANETDEGILRHPVFLRVRDDLRPEDLRERDRSKPEESAQAREPDAAAAKVAAAGALRKVTFTNRDKLFWPEDGYTKGALIDYYRGIAPWLLPYLADRPVVLTRFPDGIHGKSFFQQDAPPFIPGWLRTERMWSEQAQREIDYFVCEDLESLLYVINLGAIPLHVWSSRAARLQHPDWTIIDLDPKGAPFTDVVKIALALRALAEEMELPSFIKTSGSTGLHVLLPLGGQCVYEQSRSFAELISRVVVAELPEIATLTRAVSAREGRVYLDYLQNGHGRLLVSPFSVRPLPGAPVSMPLAWDEVDEALDPKRFTITTAAARMERLGADPLRPILEQRPDLSRALDKLGARLQGG